MSRQTAFKALSSDYGGGIHTPLFSGKVPYEIGTVLGATADFLEFHR